MQESDYHRHDISDKVWELLEFLVDESECELLMTDATHVKIHPDSSVGTNQDMSKTKGGSTPKSI